MSGTPGRRAEAKMARLSMPGGLRVWSWNRPAAARGEAASPLRGRSHVRRQHRTAHTSEHRQAGRLAGRP